MDAWMNNNNNIIRPVSLGIELNQVVIEVL